MNYILVDPPEIEKFYPFTLTRPLAEMRLFGGTIKEIWERHLGSKVSYLTYPHLSKLYSIKMSRDACQNVFIPSYVLPNPNSKMTNLNIFCRGDQSLSAFSNLVKLGGLTIQENLDEILKNNNEFGLFKNLLRAIEVYYFSFEYDLNNLDLVNKFVKKISTPNSIFSNGYLDLFNHYPWCSTSFSLTSLYDKYLKLNLNFSNFQNSNINSSSSIFINDDNGPVVVEKNVTII